MRQAMASYVVALHQAYLEAAAVLPPADRARLPLLALGHLTVAAVGARDLHVIGTAERLPPPRGEEAGVDDGLDGLQWTLRFFDPVVSPALTFIDAPADSAAEEVRAVLGIRTCLYHLVVPPGSSLTAHHALHAGTGLAHAHAAAARDFEQIRAHAKGREHLVEEMHGAHVAGLVRAQVLLAHAIAPGVEGLSLDPPSTPEAARRALVQALRPGSGTQR